MWIVVDIGCLECAMDSYLLGVFTDETVAKNLAKKLNDESGSDQWFLVFPMPEADVVGKYEALETW